MSVLVVTTGEAARRLNIGAGRVRELCEAGKIHAERTDGGQLRIPVSEIERLQREGIPKLPRLMPSTKPAPAARRAHPDLLGDPSPDLVSSTEAVVRLENQVKSIDLLKKLEEGRDWFKEKADREAQRQAEADRERRQRQAEDARIARQMEWEAEWEERGMSLIPADAPAPARLKAHEALREVLSRVGPDSSDSVVRQLVDAAIARATTPWRNSQRKERIVKEAATAYSTPWSAFNSEWVGRALDAGRHALESFASDRPDAELEAAAKKAVATIADDYRHLERCDRALLTVSIELPDLISEERDAAKEAVRKALRLLPAATSDGPFARAFEMAIEPFVKEQQARRDQAQKQADQATKQLLKSVSVSFAVGLIPQQLQKLDRDWDLGEPLNVIAHRVTPAIREALEDELHGSEPTEQLAGIVRRLLKSELDLT